MQIAAFAVPAEVALADLPGAVLMREGDRFSVGTVLDATDVPEDYPISSLDPVDPPADRRCVLVLFEAWQAPGESLDYASWERVSAPESASSPRP